MKMSELGMVDRAKVGTPVTVDNELKALRTLAELCQTMEHRYESTLEEDTKILLQDKADKEALPAAGLSPTALQAIRFRHGEKWVLRDCLDVARAQWRSLLTSEKDVFEDQDTSES